MPPAEAKPVATLSHEVEKLPEPTPAAPVVKPQSKAVAEKPSPAKATLKEPAVTPEEPVVVSTTEPVQQTVPQEQATPNIQPEPAPVPVKTKPDHSIWDGLLQQYVSSSGKVNYKGLKNQKSTLDSYLNELKNYPPAGDWSRAEQMAYWINAYNAFTVKLILDNYPVASITNLHGGKPWDHKWIELGDKTYTLNNIENDILRPKYKDARIHFAVNCAAKSCPPLHNRAFTAANLESTLNSQAKAFINNSTYNSITSKSIEVSKIFDWYAGDFGNLISYLNQYSSTQINAGSKIQFKEYDWALNGY
ncbi:MAG: DUF547 domain-containing protein [Phaeodactylibacter sp.]|nr:DUF547 domain-containing protein [Phaeodactylibacter sp.]